LIGKLKVSELLFEVPRDYSNPERGTLQLFGRSVTKYEKPAAPLSEEENRRKAYKPWMVFLQDGPGFGCRPPQDSPMTNVILEKGYQMLYLDHRGTGLSSPISAATLAFQGDVHRQADYLKLFRADSIVRILSSFLSPVGIFYESLHIQISAHRMSQKQWHIQTS
jgi:hypothetical protein